MRFRPAVSILNWHPKAASSVPGRYQEHQAELSREQLAERRKQGAILGQELRSRTTLAGGSPTRSAVTRIPTRLASRDLAKKQRSIKRCSARCMNDHTSNPPQRPQDDSATYPDMPGSCDHGRASIGAYTGIRANRNPGTLHTPRPSRPTFGCDRIGRVMPDHTHTRRDDAEHQKLTPPRGSPDAVAIAVYQNDFLRYQTSTDLQWRIPFFLR